MLSGRHAAFESILLPESTLLHSQMLYPSSTSFSAAFLLAAIIVLHTYQPQSAADRSAAIAACRGWWLFRICERLLHGEVSQQHKLIHHDTAIKNHGEYDGRFDHPEMIVKTQQDCTTGHDCKFQGPCIMPKSVNCPSHDRVDLPAPTFHDGNREKGIQNVQPRYQQKDAQ
jgi:hypothetical protein